MKLSAESSYSALRPFVLSCLILGLSCGESLGSCLMKSCESDWAREPALAWPDSAPA